MRKAMLIILLIFQSIISSNAFSKNCETISGKFNCAGKPFYIRNAVINGKVVFKLNGIQVPTGEVVQDILLEKKDPAPDQVTLASTEDLMYVCNANDSLTKYEGNVLNVPGQTTSTSSFLPFKATQYQIDQFSDMIITRFGSFSPAGVPITSSVLSIEQCLRDAP